MYKLQNVNAAVCDQVAISYSIHGIKTIKPSRRIHRKEDLSITDVFFFEHTNKFIYQKFPTVSRLSAIQRSHRKSKLRFTVRNNNFGHQFDGVFLYRGRGYIFTYGIIYIYCRHAIRIVENGRGEQNSNKNDISSQFNILLGNIIFINYNNGIVL